jgi:hypothetical protein
MSKQTLLNFPGVLRASNREALAPINLTAPVISGTFVLSVTNGTYEDDGFAITFTYQWKRGGVDIVGATDSEYILVEADDGQNITCVVTATNIYASTNTESNTVVGALDFDFTFGASSEPINDDYAGNVVRLRRSSDNAELDFTADELTDGTLTTWQGEDTVFVVTFYDQSVNAYNATQVSASLQPRLSTDVASVLAVRYDGSDDYLDMGNPELLQANANKTILAWATREQITGVSQALFGAGYLASVNGGGINVGANDFAAIQFRTGGTAAGATSDPTTIPINDWNLISGVRLGNDTILYLNGVEVGRTTQALSDITPTRIWAIGARVSATVSFYTQGSIDNTMVFTRALTASENLAIYNRQKTRFGK